MLLGMQSLYRSILAENEEYCEGTRTHELLWKWLPHLVINRTIYIFLWQKQKGEGDGWASLKNQTWWQLHLWGQGEEEESNVY